MKPCFTSVCLLWCYRSSSCRFSFYFQPVARPQLRNARLRRQPYFSLHIYLLPVKPEKSVFVLLWFVWAELEAEASLPGKDTKTLSTDLIEYVQYMIREHNQDYKVRTTKLGPQWLSSGFNSKLQLLHFTANFLSYSWKFHKNKQVLTVKGQKPPSDRYSCASPMVSARGIPYLHL